MKDWKLSTPVVFVIFNRSDTTAKVFERIRQAKPPKLLVIADGPRADRPDDVEKCAAARAVIDSVDWECEVIPNYALDNMGLRRRVSSGLTWAFEIVDQAIILEDDCLPDISFFRFCEELLDKYSDSKEIMMISGDNAHGYIPEHQSSYYFSRYPLIWGWATWKRAWQYYDDSMQVWISLRENGWLEQYLRNQVAVEYWSDLFDKNYYGFNSWARAWILSCWVQKGLCVVSSQNLVSNIGFGKDATHTITKGGSRDSAESYEISFPLEHPTLIQTDTEADSYIEEAVFSGQHKPQVLKKLIEKSLIYLNNNENEYALASILGLEENIKIRTKYAKAVTLAKLDRLDEALSELDDFLTFYPLHLKANYLYDQLYPRHLGNVNIGRTSWKVIQKIKTPIDFKLYLSKYNRDLEINGHLNLSLKSLGGDPQNHNYGRWFIPHGFLDEQSICYCAGAGEDITFELDLVSHYQCSVHIFDPTPRSVIHIREVIRILNNKNIYNSISELDFKYTQFQGIDISKIIFNNYGVSGKSGLRKFYTPKDPSHVSHSALNLQNTTKFFEANCKSLESIMAELSHSSINLLKMDIEGSEYEVIRAIVLSKISIDILCVEFDEGHHPLDGLYLQRIVNALESLKSLGMTLVYIDNWNFTFISKHLVTH